MRLDKINEVVDVVRSYGEDYWNKDTNTRELTFAVLNGELSRLFNVTKPEIKIIPRALSITQILGISNRQQNVIQLNKYSLVTYLHEFFHHLGNSDEVDARIFSNMIFGMAYPEKISKLKLKGGIVKKVKIKKV